MVKNGTKKNHKMMILGRSFNHEKTFRGTINPVERWQSTPTSLANRSKTGRKKFSCDRFWSKNTSKILPSSTLNKNQNSKVFLLKKIQKKLS